MAYSYDRRAEDEAPSDFEQAMAVLNRELKPLKNHGWWDPPHNYVVNSALMELNGWEYTIMPFQAAKTAYRPAGGRFPEGIVIDPNWRPTDEQGPHTARAAEIFVRFAKSKPSVQDSVRNELLAIERHFKIEIPSGIKASILSETPKVAQRRWGVDRLRRKKILVPFDGSKPIQLGSWD